MKRNVMTTTSNTSMRQPGQASTSQLYKAALYLILLLAFGLRLRSLTRFQYHIDEFFSLAAANLIAQQGQPLYPTGLFYDPGLPFSYIDGILFWLLGFSEALGRWPSVIFGTLSVVFTYWLGSRVLRSKEVGMLAALWLALSLESVEWAGRARMISLAQWLALASVALLWLALTRQSSRYRLLFALSYGLTLLTHFSTIVLLPAWGVATAVVMWSNKIRLQWSYLRDGLFFIAVLAVVLTSGIYFQPPPTWDFTIGDTNLDDKTGALLAQPGPTGGPGRLQPFGSERRGQVHRHRIQPAGARHCPLLHRPEVV
jgi:4-amino-4-deoxy-L-arabinose transferase-like glycosyltransferase